MTIWGAAIVAGGSIIGGIMNKKSGDSAAKNSEAMAKADRDWQEKMYGKTLQDNRPDQTNDFGQLKWTQDPTTGKWSQTSHLNPAEAARLEDYRQIAADRMATAKGGYHTDWNSMGFGKLAKAALGIEGDTGGRSWANQKMASTANDFLRNGQAPPNMAAQMGIGPPGGGGPGTANTGQYPNGINPTGIPGGGGAPGPVTYQPGMQGANFSAGGPPSGGGAALGKQFDPSMLGGQPAYGPTSDFAAKPPPISPVVSGNHVEIAPGYKAGSQFDSPAPPTQPSSPPQRGGGGPTPEQLAMADALRRQQEMEAQSAANSGNGSG
jgi:hypothetical protein